MNQFFNGVVRLEVGDLLHLVIETVEEAGHGLFGGFLHIGSDHCQLHFFVILFHRLVALLEGL